MGRGCLRPFSGLFYVAAIRRKSPRNRLSGRQCSATLRARKGIGHAVAGRVFWPDAQPRLLSSAARSLRRRATCGRRCPAVALAHREGSLHAPRGRDAAAAGDHCGGACRPLRNGRARSGRAHSRRARGGSGARGVGPPRAQRVPRRRRARDPRVGARARPADPASLGGGRLGGRGARAGASRCTRPQSTAASSFTPTPAAWVSAPGIRPTSSGCWWRDCTSRRWWIGHSTGPQQRPT